MRYTNQVINGNVNIQSLVSNKKYLRTATVVMVLPVAIFALVIFTIALVPAAGMDFGRYVRLEYIRQLKIYHRVNYINEVTKSLTDDRNERDEACKLLISLI